MQVVRKIPVSDLKENTYTCWAKHFANYLSSLPGDDVHIVFNNYEITEEVSISKGRPNKGQERKITSLDQSLPKLSEWEPFLSNDNNKKRLTLLLCDYILLPHSIKKNIYVTKGEKCFQKIEHGVIEIQTLKSNHKEADHRIIHHTHFASNQHDSVCIVADGSNIFLVLLLYISRRCCYKIYFCEGTHSSKKGILYHNVSFLSQHLGPSISDILPALHALTGHDYTNQFYGCSKYESFKIMQRKKEMINLFSSLSTRNIDFGCVIEFILRVIYNRPRTETTPGDLRYACYAFCQEKRKEKK